MFAGLLAVSAAAGLVQGLTSCQRPERGGTARPLSVAEASRLAGMRLANYTDGGAGLRATIGRPGRELRLAGWIDWRRPLAYLRITGGTGDRQGATGDAGDRLVQAVPGVIATRSGDPGGSGPRTPPVVPPADGWAVRTMSLESPAAAPLDAFALLLFTIASDRPDAADALVRSDARWMRRDQTGGVPVDVLLGPAVPPTGPTATPDATTTPGPAYRSLDRMGGAVRYWLDHRSRVHHLEALLAADLPVRIDLLRADRRPPAAIAALGGHPISPRAVSHQEARRLSGLRLRNHAAGGGRVTVTLPTGDGGTVGGTGWVDWRGTVAYLRLTGPHDRAPAQLLRADRLGVATRRAPRAPRQGAAAGPPLPPPDGPSWRLSRWSSRGDEQGTYDLELLLNELLSVAAPGRDPVRPLRAHAVRLRTDRLADGLVAVYEMPKRAERGEPAGRARLRYWVAQDGVLRRLELRTRGGAFAQLDIEPGRVPRLPASGRGRHGAQADSAAHFSARSRAAASHGSLPRP